MIEIDEYNNYDDVYQIWQDLNRQYKGGELALDWQLHRELWERFHYEAGSGLKIIVASEAGSCVGILPFSKSPPESSDAPPEYEWVYGEEGLISREYFCSPEIIDAIVPYLPPHSCTDLSCFYRPRNVTRFTPHPGCIVDLKTTESAYLSSIKPGDRKHYLKTEQMNSDMEVVVDNAVREDIVGALREQYIEFWMTKVADRAKGDAEDSKLKILKDFALFSEAERLGKLIVLHFFLNGRLVAANFAVRRENDRVDDYLCLRDTDKSLLKRRLGVYAIIKNMQYCRSIGIRYYDLSDFRAAYKQAFLNTAFQYWMPKTAPLLDHPQPVGLSSPPEEDAMRKRRTA